MPADLVFRTRDFNLDRDALGRFMSTKGPVGERVEQKAQELKAAIIGVTPRKTGALRAGVSVSEGEASGFFSGGRASSVSFTVDISSVAGGAAREYAAFVSYRGDPPAAQRGGTGTYAERIISILGRQTL